MMRKFSEAAPPLIVLLLFIAGFLEPSSAAEVETRHLTVSAVQYEVELADYRSAERFASEMEPLVAEAAKRGARLVVFPEYINVFLAFSGSFGTSSAGESGSSRRSLGGELHDLLLRRSGVVRSNMNSIWGALAERYSLWIVAGSYFASGGEADGENEDGLYNRAIVYGPEGKVIYEQDKVYLTPFEKTRLRLSAGKIEDAGTFDIDGWTCALTICRDSFFDEWNELFDEADLWVDIKANGEEYGEQTPALFERALPERIGETEVPYGLTACLNGEFLDLFWEGPSSIIRHEAGSAQSGGDAGGWSYVKRAATADTLEVIVAELRLSGN